MGTMKKKLIDSRQLSLIISESYWSLNRDRSTLRSFRMPTQELSEPLINLYVMQRFSELWSLLGKSIILRKRHCFINCVFSFCNKRLSYHLSASLSLYKSLLLTRLRKRKIVIFRRVPVIRISNRPLKRNLH